MRAYHVCVYVFGLLKEGRPEVWKSYGLENAENHVTDGYFCAINLSRIKRKTRAALSIQILNQDGVLYLIVM